MPFAVQDVAVDGIPLEIVQYNARWRALIDCMLEGLPLHTELQEILEAHKHEQPPVEERATKPEERVAQIKADERAGVRQQG